jgi:hypothetical protein
MAARFKERHGTNDAQRVDRKNTIEQRTYLMV